MTSTRWLLTLKILDFSAEHPGAAAHQLHQRASAAVLQPPHVCTGAGGVQEGRYPMDIHRFWNGLASLH